MQRSSLPFVCTTINQEPVCALVDSGSAVSVIDYAWFLEYDSVGKFAELRPPSQGCATAGGQRLPLLGECRVWLRICDFTWPITILVAKKLSVPVILGADCLKKIGFVLDFASKSFHFKFAPSVSIAWCSCRLAAQVNSISLSEEKIELGHLTRSQQEQLRSSLGRFSDVLVDRLGVTNLIKYKIQLTDDVPVRQGPYRLSPPKMAFLRKKIAQMLQDGVIRPSTSPYASPIFLVPKPEKNDYRPVVDYRMLNKKVILESVPLPDLQNAFTWFAGAKYFSVLDLNQAYHQIPLTEDSKPVTAFCTDWNLYEFNRVPFGLSTGAAVLSRLLDRVLGELKFKGVYNYLDDVVVYSDSFEQHVRLLEQVLTRFREAGLTVKPSKVTLACNQISFLGHLVSEAGVAVDPERTQGLLKFPPPTTTKGVAKFIGMTNYFRRFVPNFAQIAAPLNDLRKKGCKFEWGETQQAAFEALKSALVNSPVLAIPDFNKKFIVQTDASNAGIAAVLLQESELGRRPVAYISRRLSETERKYSVYECEALAVLFALERFRFYLEHREFELETDNQALSWVLARPRKTGRIARWAVRISAFQFSVKHIRGSDNCIADALSRMYGESEDGQQEDGGEYGKLVGAILSEIPDLFGDLRARQEADPQLREICHKLRRGEQVEGYVLNKGILCCQRGRQKLLKICLPKELIPAVFHYFHHSLAGGHLGIHKTIGRIQEHVTWPGLVRDVRRMVGECNACGVAKPDSGPKKGLLCSDREETPMDKIFIDHVGPLPRTKAGNRYILVVVDAFTRFCWLMPTGATTASNTIRQLERIFAVFGPPRALVSDNAAAFLSNLFRRFCFDKGIKHIRTTPYYPQPSFAERVNRNLKAALVAYHAKSRTRWDESIPWLNLAFNSAQHEALKASPASLMLAFPLNSPLSNLWSLKDLLPDEMDRDKIRENWTRARRNISLAHERLRDRYNRGRRLGHVRKGEIVFVRNLNPQKGNSDGGVGKLAPRFLGPCVVRRMITPVNLEIQDVKSKKIMRVHISQVKVKAANQ